MCSGGVRRKSPPPANPPPPLHPPSGGKPSLRPAPSTVAVPSACGPPYGEIRPTPSSYAASGLMSLTRIVGPIATPPSKYYPMSGHPLPP